MPSSLIDEVTEFMELVYSFDEFFRAHGSKGTSDISNAYADAMAPCACGSRLFQWPREYRRQHTPMGVRIL